MKNIISRIRFNVGIGQFCQGLKPINSLLCEIAFFIWICFGTMFPIVAMMHYPGYLSELWITRPELVIAFYSAIIVEVSIIIRILLIRIRLEKQTRYIKSYEAGLEEIIDNRTKELQVTIAKLEVVASTDHLTKIANRRLLKEALHEEFSRSLRTKREFTVIMFDIDHFKKINDINGHLTGDKILVAISDTVKKVVRDIDIFGRFGGEEFLVVLPESNLTIAADVAERIRTTIAKINLDGVSCTASLGVSSSTGLLTPSEILGLADDALYYAKNAGRNNVQIITNNCSIKCDPCVEKLKTKCKIVKTEYTDDETGEINDIDNKLS